MYPRLYGLTYDKPKSMKISFLRLGLYIIFGGFMSLWQMLRLCNSNRPTYNFSISYCTYCFYKSSSIQVLRGIPLSIENITSLLVTTKSYPNNFIICGPTDKADNNFINAYSFIASYIIL